MTEADMKQFLKDNSEAIKTAVKDRLISQIIESHRWSISDAIAVAVNEFIATEIVPEVKAHLVSEKSSIIDAAIKGTVDIGDQLAKSLVMAASKNLTANSYQTKRILEALFA